MADRGPRPAVTWPTLWRSARDIDAALAQRLGLTGGEEETRRRALAWGVGVLGVLLVALVVSPMVAGGQSDPDQLAPEATTTEISATPSTAAAAVPLAGPDAYETFEDQPLTVDATDGVLADDAYENGGVPRLVAELVEAPSGSPASPLEGEVDLAEDGSFTYTPPPDFAGVDTFFYVAADREDPSTASAPAQVEISVTPVNDAPVAVPDSVAMSQDTRLRVDAPGVLANDTDVDGGTSALSATRTSLAKHGTAVVSPAGDFTYVPDPGFLGLDSFRYTVSDGSSVSEPAQVTIEVREANLGPSARDDGYATATGEVLSVAGPGVLANDADPNQDELTAELDVGPPAGDLDLQEDGGFTYTPPDGFRGLMRFTYVARDTRLAASEPASVTVVVGPASEAFALRADTYQVLQGTSLAVPAPGVLGNDGLTGTARQAQGVRGPSAGALELRSDGSFLYVPDAGFAGQDSFDYAVTLGDIVSPATTVVLVVEGVEAPAGPTPPTVVAPPTTSPPPPPSVAPTSTTSSAPPAEGLPGSGDGDGEEAGNEGGGTAAPGPSGPGGAGDGPAPPGDPLSGVTIDVAGDLTGELGEAPLVSLAPPAPGGEVAINGDGTVTYVPAPEFLGRDSFGYRACTIDETCATGSVQLVVRPASDGDGLPEVRYQVLRDGAVPWLVVAIALVVLAFAVVMAVLVVRAVRGPADPFAGVELAPDTPSPASGA